MNEGPIVGLILTQVLSKHLESVRQPTYLARVMDVLRQGGVNLDSFSKKLALVLPSHNEKFSPQGEREIRNYILSFKPRRVPHREHRIHFVEGASRFLSKD